MLRAIFMLFPISYFQGAARSTLGAHTEQDPATGATIVTPHENDASMVSPRPSRYLLALHRILKLIVKARGNISAPHDCRVGHLKIERDPTVSSYIYRSTFSNCFTMSSCRHRLVGRLFLLRNAIRMRAGL